MVNENLTKKAMFRMGKGKKAAFFCSYQPFLPPPLLPPFLLLLLLPHLLLYFPRFRLVLYDFSCAAEYGDH